MDLKEIVITPESELIYTEKEELVNTLVKCDVNPAIIGRMAAMMELDIGTYVPDILELQVKMLADYPQYTPILGPGVQVYLETLCLDNKKLIFKSEVVEVSRFLRTNTATMKRPLEMLFDIGAQVQLAIISPPNYCNYFLQPVSEKEITLEEIGKELADVIQRHKDQYLAYVRYLMPQIQDQDDPIKAVGKKVKLDLSPETKKLVPIYNTLGLGSFDCKFSGSFLNHLMFTGKTWMWFLKSISSAVAARHQFMKDSRDMMLKAVEIKQAGYRDVIYNRIYQTKFGFGKPTKQEWDAVLKEYAMIQRAAALKSPFTGLVNAIMNADNAKKITLFQKLKAQTKLDALMCQHSIEFLEALEHRVDALNIKQDQINKFGELIDEIYFCKLCGASIATTDNYGLSVFARAEGYDADDELGNFIWKKVSFIVRNMCEFRHVRTHKEVNKFVSDIASKLYDMIDTAYKKLIKIKNVVADELELYKQYYTSLYTYACLMKTVYENANEIKFINRTGDSRFNFGFETPSAKPLLDFVIDKITTSMDVLLRQLNLDESAVGQTFRSIYQDVSKHFTSTITGLVSDVSLENYFVNDPLYNALTAVHRIAERCGNEKCYQLSWLPKTVLGKTISEIEKDRSAFYAGSRVPIPEMPKLDVLPRIYWKSQLASVAAGIYGRNVAALLQYTQENIRVPFRIVDENLVLGAELVGFTKRYDPLHDLEARVLAYRIISSSPTKAKTYTATRMPIIGENNNAMLGLIYGIKNDVEVCKKHKIALKPNFHKHIWNLFDNGTHCSVCGQNKARIIAGKPYDDIVQDYRMQIMRESFYNQYAILCPMSGYHTGSPCSKCKITPAIIADKDTEFFKKHMAVLKPKSSNGTAYKRTLPIKIAPLTEFQIKLEPLLVALTEASYTIMAAGSKLPGSSLAGLRVTAAEYKNMFANIGLSCYGTQADFRKRLLPEAQRSGIVRGYITGIFIKLANLINAENIQVYDPDIKFLLKSLPPKVMEEIKKTSISGIQKQLFGKPWYAWDRNLLINGTNIDAEYVGKLYQLLSMLVKIDHEVAVFIIRNILTAEDFLCQLEIEDKVRILSRMPYDENSASMEIDKDSFEELIAKDAKSPFSFADSDYSGQNAEPN